MGMNHRFTDVCFITNDVLRLRAFYEAVFGVKAEGDEIHSGISVDGLTLVFDHVDIADENPTFRYVKAGGANNVIVGFNVDDVDAEYKRLLILGAEMLNEPTTHPWGARSFQFRDPDGNILNFRSMLRNDKLLRELSAAI
jgi:predicted enzyme related to lactoylglutathione lyase